MRHVPTPRPRAALLLALVVLLLVPVSVGVGVPGVPGPLPAEASTPVTPMLSSFGDHTCELVPDGTVRCWGNNSNGQLGDGTIIDRSTRVTVVLSDGSPLQHVVAIAVGSGHTCALLGAGAGSDAGTVRCWGWNLRGQLGDDTTNDRSHPVAVVGPDGTGKLSDVTAIAPGGEHTCALRTGGQVLCWGDNSAGQLGRGGSAASGANPSPAGVSFPGAPPATRITAGFQHACATVATSGATSGDDLYCWGSNRSGELGMLGGSVTESAAPVLVSGIGAAASGPTITSITAGSAFTCATVTEGSTTTGRCWGDNSFGQLGDGTTAQRSTPVTVLADDGAALEVSAISAGSGHTCALAAGGAMLCWGANNFGQLGNGTATSTSPIPPNPTPTPVRLVGTSGATLTSITSIAPGNQHTCALAADGTGTTARRCWGRNDIGQLGAGTTTDTELNPVSVLLTVPDRAGILALDAPSCTAAFSTADGPFERLTAPSAFDVEVTFDRPALLAWVTALTSSSSGGPLTTLWGIDPAEDLRLVETALAVRPVDGTAAGGGTGTSGAVVPTVAVAGTEMRDLTRTLFGPDAPTFDLAVNATATTRYSRSISSGTIDDYPTRFDNIFRSSPDGRTFTETQLTTPLDEWGLAPITPATPFRPEVFLSLRLSTGSFLADEQMVVVLPCGGPATLPVVDPPVHTPAASSPAVSCSPDVLAVGTEVACTVTGGAPGIDILWRAAVNPVIASDGVTLDADGRGAFGFTVPPSALGGVVTVELVEWTRPVAIGGGAVVGGPVPSTVPAGEGGTGPVGLLALIALLGATGAVGVVGAVGASRGRRPEFCPVEKSPQNP